MRKCNENRFSFAYALPILSVFSNGSLLQDVGFSASHQSPSQVLGNLSVT